MATDDERREAVRRLRYDARGGALPYSDFLAAVAYDVGAEKEHVAVLNRIADLIEPAPSCEFWDAEEQECYSVRTVRPVDRGALLELADECDSVHMHKVARRIREALGEAGE